MTNKQTIDIDIDYTIDENWAEDDDSLIDLPDEIITKLLAEAELTDNAPGARRYSIDEIFEPLRQKYGYKI
ncbi:MAG: hypothetical protein FWB71_06935 [Defluviitaleaceae bacterium]|nr:hypothetical protein [Defluviitaleaceae bacterium]